MKALDWILGREPVATATGIAAVVTAGLGLAATFGLPITAEQIAAIGALAAALAGWAARGQVRPVTSPAERQLDRAAPPPPPDPRGSVPLALFILIGVAVVLLAGIAVSCDALFEDEQERNDIGLVAYHDECDPSWDDCSSDSYNYDYSSRDRNRNRGRDRGAFSPDFDRSPVHICMPSATCYYDGPPPDEREMR